MDAVPDQANFTLTIGLAGEHSSGPGSDQDRHLCINSPACGRFVTSGRGTSGNWNQTNFNGSGQLMEAATRHWRYFVNNRILRSRTFTLSAVFCLLALFAVRAQAQAGPDVAKVTTVAGGFINDGHPALSSALQNPSDVARDSKGNLYITDHYDHRIRELTTTGVLKTIAGTGIAGFNGDGLTAKSTQINSPRGILVDSNQNIIFADTANCRIRKINPSKIVSTIAGTGTCGFSGDHGMATAAMLSFPNGLWLDSAGNLYIADTFNQRIRVVNSLGVINTVAGNGSAGFSGDGGPATSASLNYPRHAIPDSAGNLYIADQQNHRVRRVDTGGTITTIGGNGETGCKGDGGQAINAHLGFPTRLLIFNGGLYISNGGCGRVRVINLASGVINTAVGTTFGFDGNGHDALTGTQLNGGVGLLLNSTSTAMLIVDNGNDQLRTWTFSSNLVSGAAGGYVGDGLSGSKAALNASENIAFDSKGNLYIADFNNHRIRKVTPAGIISTFAGTGISGYSGDGGPATSAQIYFPFGVTVDKSDNVYISDNGNGVIRKVDTSGTITTFASDVNFTDLLGITADTSGNLYVADDIACTVFQVTPAGSVSVAAGVLFTCGYSGDHGPPTSANLNSPIGVGVDSAGDLYIADTFNNVVREVSGGVITTIAGNGTCGFSGDGGPPTAAMLCIPTGVTTDSTSNVYIGDYGTARVRKIAGGLINTIAGSGNVGYNGNGLPALSTNIDGPNGLAVTSKGVFYADDGQYRVRKIH